jgi:hypothetical protein
MKIKNLFTAFALAMVVIFAGCEKDDKDMNPAPTVNSVDPENNAVDVALNKVITVTFSNDMDASTINSNSFTLSEGTNTVNGTVSYSDKTAKFTPTNPLTASTNYAVLLSVEAEDTNGTAIENSKEWSFTTAAMTDDTAPTVSSKDPNDNAVNVERNKVISVAFSEEMDPASINDATFTVTQAGSEITGTVSYSGMTAKFTPTSVLAAEMLYNVKITTAAQDLSGNTLEANTEWSFTTSGSASGLAVVDLGASGNYVILAKTAINNNPISAITGDLGLSPAATSYITGLSLTDFTGYATSEQVTGMVYAADMVSPTPTNLTTAVENMITAYNDAAGRSTPDFLELGTGDIGGKTLTPGLYKWTSTVTIPTDVSISGTADDVWIFQISGDLNMSAAVNITLEGGAKVSNIFWQVAGEASFGATSHFEGVILSMTGITFQTGASFTGRALAQTAVILDGNTIVQPE